MNDLPSGMLPDAVAPTSRSPLVRMAKAWDRFFFSPADPTTLGMVRICCGLIVLYTLMAYTLDLQEFYGAHGLIDLKLRNEWRREYPQPKLLFTWKAADRNRAGEAYFEKWGVYEELTHAKGSPIWSIWFHVTDPSAMMAVQIGILVVAFFFTIGLCTRITSVLTWFAMVGYIHRSDYTVFGVDTMMTIGLTYLMIGPSGAALSVDRLIVRWWRSYRWLRRQGDKALGDEARCRVPPSLLAVSPSVSANLAIRLLQINTCIVYLAAGLAKLLGPAWWTGEAVWGVLANFEFAPMQYPAYMGFLRSVSQERWVWQIFMLVSTMFTLAFEISFAFLVWNRKTRWVIIFMAIALHGGIGLFMGLKTFSLMMLTLVLSFVPPEVVHRLLARLARGPSGLRLYFPARSGGSLRAAAFVRALDIWDQMALIGMDLPAGGKNRLKLETRKEESFTGPSVAFRLLRSLGIFRLFLPWNWFGFLSRSGEKRLPTDSPSGLPEPISIRPAGEVIKKGVPHVKQKR